MKLRLCLQGYEKCFALCQYTTGLIIKEIQKVKLRYSPDRIGVISTSLRSYKTWPQSQLSPRSFMLMILSWLCPVSSLWRRGTFNHLRTDLPFNTKNIL